jgi:hypothetical protein
LLLPAFIAKNVGYNKLGGSCLSKNTEELHVNMVRSVWRRLKKDLKEAIIRDLQPRKDVKGGGGVRRESKPTTDDTGTRRGY